MGDPFGLVGRQLRESAAILLHDRVVAEPALVEPFAAVPPRLRHLDQRALARLRHDHEGVSRLARAVAGRPGRTDRPWQCREAVRTRRPVDPSAPPAQREANPSDICPSCACCASTAANAVMLTTPRAVVDGVRICTGRAAPMRMGPTGSASPKNLII